MKRLAKSLAPAVVFATVFAGMPVAVHALDFEPLGEGVLPSGKYVENFRLTLYPGETIPWHYHPGVSYGILTAGRLTEEKGCGNPQETLFAGSAFSELPFAIHRVFNNGTEPVVLVITFIMPPAYAGYTGTVYVNGPRCHDADDQHDDH